MPKPIAGLSTARKLTVTGAVALAALLGVVAPGSPLAHADVVEIGPDPGVSSRQADAVAGNSTHGGVRRAPKGSVRGQGDSRGGSIKAVPHPGSRANGFTRGRYSYPGLGSW